MGRGVRCRDLAGDREHHRDGVLGSGDRVAEGRVHHHDPFGAGSRDIDIIDPDPGPSDDLQIVGTRDQVCRRLGGRADRQAVILTNDIGQFLRLLAQTGLEVHLDIVVLEDTHGIFAQLVGDQYFRHVSCPFYPRSPCRARRHPLPLGGRVRVGEFRQPRVPGSWRKPNPARGRVPAHPRFRRSSRTRSAIPEGHRDSR